MCLIYLQYGAPAEHWRAHEHHAIAWDSGWRSIVNVMWFKNHFTVGSHGYAVTICQCEGSVIVQNRVQVLNPDGINWPIQNYPDILSWEETKLLFVYMDMERRVWFIVKCLHQRISRGNDHLNDNLVVTLNTFSQWTAAFLGHSHELQSWPGLKQMILIIYF